MVRGVRRVFPLSRHDRQRRQRGYSDGRTACAMSPLSSMLEPGDQVEKFEIIEEMGSGGMARVFKVRHVLLGSLHALKVLDQRFVRDADMRQRFLAEGQIQAKLRHPNIVQVTDIIAAPGIAGLVVEFIDGRALDDHIEAMRGPPSHAEVKALFLPLLAGLGYAHDNGVVHRDIKPANILVASEPDGRLVPKIVDFGIAKVLEGGLGEGQAKGRTGTGARMGTLHYMSPEQVKGASSVDARADIYSVAATLYEFVTLQLPFEADSEYDTMRNIVESEAPPVRELQPGVDPIIDACVAIGLAKDPGKRFQTCAEFSELLAKAGTGEGASQARGPGNRATGPEWVASSQPSREPARASSALSGPGESSVIQSDRVGAGTEVSGRASRPRTKGTAIALALLLGVFGGHKFYLGDKKAGWLYVLLAFCCYISAVFALVDAVRLLMMSAPEFDQRYNGDPGTASVL